MNAPSAPPPLPDDLQGASPEQIRRAIDLVATIRARGIRVALFGCMLYRPDPAAPEDDGHRHQYLEVIDAQATMITAVCATLKSGGPLPEIPPQVCAWISRIARTQPASLDTILQFEQLSRRVQRAAHEAGPHQRQALADHLAFGRTEFFHAVTLLCDALWADLARQQMIALRRATAASEALSGRLARLETIGQHVRLVSLNASVEAARAGEQGRGLMVIAHEFKGLAEEIQQLARDARADMTALT